MIFAIKTHAQLGFCTGHSGTPIFTETFGTGTTNTPLPFGTTTYTYANGQPNDGFYTVSNRTNGFGWHDIQDHTVGDVNGRSLIVNADFTPGEFYQTAISGLCENTTYEFSSWMINLLPSNHSSCGSGIPINVKFEIWDNTNTQLLASGDTGNINSTLTPNWEQYALVFQTEPGQTSVILKMLNNGVGGCGNDLAIDDIVFKTCGDSIFIETPTNETQIAVCENQLPFSTTLTVIPDFTIFATHFYQWQQSNDGVNWTDILGENNKTYNTPPVNTNTFYRAKVAEDAINLSNNSCNTTSEIFEIQVIPQPNAPTSNGDVFVCENSNAPITANAPSSSTINWFDAPTNGNLLKTNSNSYTPTVSGTYYAESETIIGGCISNSRTPIEIVFYNIPQIEDETLEFCENETIDLHADTNITTATYLWSTGETTEFITVNQAGTYTVEVSNQTCSVTKTITLSRKDLPIFEQVISDGNNIVITTANTGNFIFSINGNIYNPNQTFTNIEGGLYTIYAKEQSCNTLVTKTFIHFYIPKYFTPNNDGFNDTFDLKGIELYENSEVSIFNRYGKLIKYSKNEPFSWDGTLSGNPLESGDYWYSIIINGQKTNGHFTLKH
ncbi:T9SS type B sorting domain-containing protein [Algibacter miyuki]|uniref:T9SS type B sorting domain-containing protein n=1 Tax=Algibacter miyuki TaxID=1306933 RepID=A0ABV5GW09_9FLAO|nr:T9SS type B sorting domain-containing protein [Algibacter miyuki]MDN3665147.1 T9SS type B sorting domain-containing protein [Algibacter miyuki]